MDFERGIGCLKRQFIGSFRESAKRRKNGVADKTLEFFKVRIGYVIK